MSHLFTPLTLDGLTLANRIAVSPMCMYSAAADGLLTSWHRFHLGGLSLSGAGLMIVECTAVEARGRISLRDLGLYNDQQEEAFARLIEDIRQNSDIAIGIQLGHAGRKGARTVPGDGERARPLLAEEGGWPGIAPSAVSYSDGWAEPEALDARGLVEVREAFADAARRADRCGFDLVEIHGAHGYLLHAFRAPNSNHRQDDYGGSRENRHRFPLEVIAGVRAALSPTKPLGVRANGEDWHDDGVTLDDTIAYAKALKDLGVAYMTTSGGAGSPHIKPPPVTPGYMVPFARAVRREAGIQAMAVGMIVTAQQADQVIASGDADLVAVGRGFLDDPRWAWHAAAALGETVPYPVPYRKALPGAWKGYPLAHALPPA
ncbi:NADH:flavin oxidoreductase/NADH oxidase [Rhodoligotrophos appendicifer]|uniref:NADH:flavin oxidoreductase/NADH oxidase n=1 Tax=Rhodoligotrophos appendicifer TaxID=987056 RepID=UPI001185B143